MQRCEAKINFFKKKCNITTEASCVYCGDFFCIEHGIIEDDHMYVCSKKKCVLKYEDLQQHHIWLENAYSLNAQKKCGRSKCSQSYDHLCSRCSIGFCMNHIDFMRSNAITELTLVCKHCEQRKGIWNN